MRFTLVGEVPKVCHVKTSFMHIRGGATGSTIYFILTFVNDKFVWRMASIWKRRRKCEDDYGLVDVVSLKNLCNLLVNGRVITRRRISFD